MTTSKQHILLNGYISPENYRSRSTGRSPQVLAKDRLPHGTLLLNQYNHIIARYTERPRIPPITDEYGIYVKLVSFELCELPIDKIDNSYFKLCSLTKRANREIAILFISDGNRTKFINKINEYLDPLRDGAEFPRNHLLIDSIESIELADITSFWTDKPELIPADRNEEKWFELWLKGNIDDATTIAQSICERINGRLGNSSINFFDTTVLLIKTSLARLSICLEIISNLKELRAARDDISVLVNSLPTEQHQWADDVTARINRSIDADVSICVLDTGVNYNNPLLSSFSNTSLSTAWDSSWPLFDDYNQRPYNDHGSRQAGLCIYGDFLSAILSNQLISIPYHIESGRILPPRTANNPALYGAITTGTSSRLELENPNWRRVYSLAVTAEPNAIGGQPSSWSAEIDKFCFGLEDDIQRLFIISAGNSQPTNLNIDYWDSVTLAEIEDPAQSWNALTIGAYTDKTTHTDPEYMGWSPFAASEDIAPSTRSSISWGWRKHAPYKPDLVEEGGNKLLSPNRDEMTNTIELSLLTTSGRASNQLFEVNSDTSAACALVSRQAALLMAEYPEYWPETIRGLLVHTAKWTSRMRERYRTELSRSTAKLAKETLLRMVGYGVPDLQRAMHSAENALTLVSQSEMTPFNRTGSGDPTLNEMHLFSLPWPVEALRLLPPETNVTLRITLSYFIEPNPSQKGFRRQYTYQSHGLRFAVIRPNQSLDNFRASINRNANSEEYNGPEGDASGWSLGPQLRARGSLHSDAWKGSAADLAEMNVIAVYPVGGWWKYRTAQDRYANRVRYSLLVSIDVPDENIDIYSEVENIVNIDNQISIDV
ncbi:TPA: S8 family peptidase [Salmonella enterica subsp. enterica serovar Tamberma]|nr:S8 family peptidase [Salmonella enterica]EKJ3119808.1 S8 family peptidase [Salmonella enterica]HBJ6794843.1 S8 family peptidase [Salmonella enterica subsp. enterica serovar Tamberma]